jgi:DNA invertase Pin-like site-specific DNA recombinase
VWFDCTPPIDTGEYDYSMPVTAGPTRRAIGIVRVSEVGGREGNSFASPTEQRDRIEDACERDGLRLLDVLEELDVSGGKPLDQRLKLRHAVQAVEAGEADVIVAAYFDRLMRSLRVQDELVSRVEAAGGQVLAVDVGQVSNGSAGQWLSGTMLGAVSEYQRRSTAERTAEAQARAVARGVWMSPQTPPGYVRGDHGGLVPDPATKDVITEAFAMRAAGSTMAEIHGYLGAHGVEVSYAAVTRLLRNRAYLGEVNFGKLQNLEAHEPIITPEVWKAAQRTKPTPGRRAKSERLLARLGVLRCASCGRRMSVSSGHHGTRPLYRCSSHVGDDCPHPVTIAADLVEKIVTDAVRAALAGAEGRASVETNRRDAEHALEQAQAELDAAIRMLAGFEDETATRARLAELRLARDGAQERLDRLGGQRAAVTINAAADWDRLSLDARRDLIRATVERVSVAPGRGVGRVTVELVGE